MERHAATRKWAIGSTSFPGFSPILPLERVGENPGNEVGIGFLGSLGVFSHVINVFSLVYQMVDDVIDLFLYLSVLRVVDSVAP